MMAALATPRLVERLPRVRGRYSEGASLARITWFGVGGPAEVDAEASAAAGVDTEYVRLILAAKAELEAQSQE